MQGIFKALSDTTRRDIIFLLMEQEMTVKDINSRIGIPNSTLNHHLEILFQNGLVTRRKEGTFIYYSVSLSLIEEWVAYVSMKFKRNGGDTK